MKMRAILWKDGKAYDSKEDVEHALCQNFTNREWGFLLNSGMWRKVRRVYAVKVRKNEGEKLCYRLGGRDHCFISLDWEESYRLFKSTQYRDVTEEYYLAYSGVRLV